MIRSPKKVELGVGVLSELATFHPLATFRCELGEHADTAKLHDLQRESWTR